MVVLNGFPDTNSFQLSEEAFVEEFGCFPD